MIARLQREGIAARAVANPLRGLTADADYIASIVAQTAGDVVLVGHSYGGAVATYAGSNTAKVKALVFVGAFALDTGESVQSATSGYPDSELASALQPWTYPGGELPEFTIESDKYRRVLAADVSDEEAAQGVVIEEPEHQAFRRDHAALGRVVGDPADPDTWSVVRPRSAGLNLPIRLRSRRLHRFTARPTRAGAPV